MDVILHLGAHRCGSTTFQRFLQSNRKAIREAGTAVWTPRQTRDGLLEGFLIRPSHINPDHIRRRRRSSGRIQMRLSQMQRAGVHELIVSEENLLGSVRNNLIEGSLYGDAEMRLSGIRQAFGGTVRRIGISIRSYDRYWASALAFAQKKGGIEISQTLLQRFLDQPRRWSDLVQEIAAAFPDAQIDVWSFERLVSRPEAQLALLTNGLSLTASAPEARSWHNQSPSAQAIENAQAIRENRSAEHKHDGVWMPFTKAQAAILQRHYADDISRLLATSGGQIEFETGATDPTQLQKQRVMPPEGGYPNEQRQIMGR